MLKIAQEKLPSQQRAPTFVSLLTMVGITEMLHKYITQSKQGKLYRNISH